MGKIKRTDIINYLINKFNFNSYLEIGVRNPNKNFNKINCKIKHSVDPKPKGECTYIMTSDDFFKKINKKQKYDIIFIDGLHVDEQVYKDVKNSIHHLNKNGVILLHDCNPILIEHTTSYEEYLKNFGTWNGTVYKAFIKLKHELKDWSCFVINEDYGCGIITQQNFKIKFLPLTTIPNNIDWDYFNKNRIELLDLIEYDNFLKKC